MVQVNFGSGSMVTWPPVSGSITQNNGSAAGPRSRGLNPWSRILWQVSSSLYRLCHQSCLFHPMSYDSAIYCMHIAQCSASLCVVCKIKKYAIFLKLRYRELINHHHIWLHMLCKQYLIGAKNSTVFFNLPPFLPPHLRSWPPSPFPFSINVFIKAKMTEDRTAKCQIF